MTTSNNFDVDESLYSRQLILLGADAMRKLGASNVLVSGMRGLGVEIAKNIILGGTKSVTVHDLGVATWSDLSSQFYVREDDIGKNRAVVSAPRLAELNHYVKVSARTDELTAESLNGYQVVVITQELLDEQLRISDICRSKNIHFIAADTKGVFGQIFCDFGPKFIVSDPTGEQLQQFVVSSISKDRDGTVRCCRESRHCFSDGDLVTFAEVRGMVELNGCKPRPVVIADEFTFSIGDTSEFSEYIGGGIVMEAKQPITLEFKSMRDSFAVPEFTVTFDGKSRPGQLHNSFHVLHEYVRTYAALPRPHCQEDVEKFVSKYCEMKDNPAQYKCLDEWNESLLRQFASCAVGDLAPMQSVIGGIAAQEVMKACSGKFTPIHQWLYFEVVECLLPLLEKKLHEKSYAPRNSRYDGQIAVFGEEFQEVMEKARYFLVGAGALGCELLKNFAMMGLGHVTVTDMDHIEKSNLNRQFLFRPADISKPKSKTAADAVKAMNPAMQVVAHTNRIGVETETIYDDNFYQNLTGVSTALDNVDARRYVDERCVYNCKPMLDCGTNGIKASLQVVIPYVTQSYGSTRDAPEKTFPMCMLKNFPNVIEHTIQWARDQFEGLFKLQVEAGMEYLTQKEAFTEKLQANADCNSVEKLKSVIELLKDGRPTTFSDCVLRARKMFEENYCSQIKQLLHHYPSDSKTSEGGSFWSGTKRCPHPLEFDASNPTHLQYVTAVANLYAEIFEVEKSRDAKAIADIATAIILPPFEPRSGVKIAETDAEEEALRNSPVDDQELVTLLASLLSLKDCNFPLHPIDFEKDDDSNFHIDFVVAASNLRAENYDIAPADRLETKRLAGRIIPAIATTTSMVVGLVCLELYKLLLGRTDVESFRNGYVNLAVPLFAFSEPLPVRKNKYNDVEFSIWDQFSITGDITLQQLINIFKDQHKLEITMVAYGFAVLYASFMTPAALEERLGLPISVLVERISKTKIPAHIKSIKLDIGANGADGEDVDPLPCVKYILPTERV